MIKHFSSLATLALAAPLALAQVSTWVPDKAHSEVDFSILHMSLSNVRGHLGNIGGTIVWNEADITKSTVNVTIDMTTVDTGVAPRDGDLKSANFFPVNALRADWSVCTRNFAAFAVESRAEGCPATGIILDEIESSPRSGASHRPDAARIGSSCTE